MLARAVRSVVIATATSLTGALLTMVVFQAVERRWSLNTILDPGTLVAFIGIGTATLILLPAFLLLQRFALPLIATSFRAALIGTLCAGVSGSIAFALVFAIDGPLVATQLLLAVASPATVPFAVGGAAFGAAWAVRNSKRPLSPKAAG